MCRVAHTRQAALDECLTFQPHMIVLDIGMPNGDGFNVVDWLRQHEDLSRMPLVAYSAHGLTQAERMQLVLGLDSLPGQSERGARATGSVGADNAA